MQDLSANPTNTHREPVTPSGGEAGLVFCAAGARAIPAPRRGVSQVAA